MNIRKPTCKLLFALVLLLSTASAQWIQTTGPYGGLVNSLAVSGTNLFAGTNCCGVFLSTNNGLSWTAASTGLTNFQIQSLAVSGTNLFAGARGNGVFLSTNNGTSWALASTGLTNTLIQSLAVSGTKLFAGTIRGVFLSTNNGATWTQAGNDLTSTSVRSLISSPNGKGGTNLLAGTDAAVFLSTDNGTSWTSASTGLTNTDVMSLAVSGANLFAGTYGTGVFLSTNNGTSWTAASTGLAARYVVSLAVSGTNIFAGTSDGGAFISTNNGTKWTACDPGLTNTGVFALAVSGTNLFAGTNRGIFLANNNGIPWTQVNNGLTDVAKSIVLTPNDRGGTNLYASTSGGVYLSTDEGITWALANMPFGYFSNMVRIDAYLFAGTYEGLFRSTDDGENWTHWGDLPSNSHVGRLAAFGENLIAATSTGVYVSTDYGISWILTSLTASVNCFAVAPSNPGSGGLNIFAGTNGGVFLSSNNGATWTRVGNGLTSTSVESLVSSPNEMGGTNLFAGTYLNVYLSTNNGTSWTALTKRLPTLDYWNHLRTLFVVPGSPGNLFAGVERLEDDAYHGYVLHLKPDACGAGSWEPFSAGLAGGIALGFTTSDTNIFAATKSSGIWRRPLSDLAFGDAYLSTQRGIITGKIFDDENLNGVQDTNEQPLTSVKVDLIGNGLRSTLSDCKGIFTFAGLDSGTYTVVQSEIQFPWITVLPISGQYTLQRSVNDSSGFFSFSNYMPKGSIRGIVFNDDNGNGIKDTNERPGSGWRIDLSGRGQLTTQTDSGGAFSFVSLPPGTYTITEEVLLPWIVSFPPSGSYSATLGLNDSSLHNDFGNVYPWCTISGKVFWDLNENGVRESTEPPLDHWLVRLSGNGRDSTLTDSLGNYALNVDRGLNVVIASTPDPWEITPVTHRGGDSVTFSDFDKHVSNQDFALHHIPKRARLIIVVDDNTNSFHRELVWGVRSGATSGIWGADSMCATIDFAEGEGELPPRDFAAYLGLFDARFVFPGTGGGSFGDGSWTDMRNFDSAAQSTVYRIALLPGYSSGGNYPMTLNWSSDSVKTYFAGPVTIDDENGHLVDMKTRSSFVKADTTGQFLRLIANRPNLTGVSYGHLTQLPKEYLLEQNYPNPFNPITTIRFGVPVFGHATLKVYNVLGEEVEALVDGSLEPGYMSVTWDASGTPSGVYFYRLTAGTFSIVKKLVLLR